MLPQSVSVTHHQHHICGGDQGSYSGSLVHTHYPSSLCQDCLDVNANPLARWGMCPAVIVADVGCRPHRVVV